MEVLALVFVWVAFLVYIARTSEETRQLHLVIVWGLMLLPTFYHLGSGLWRWLTG